MSKIFPLSRVLSPVALAAFALACGNSAQAASLTEGFETVIPAGWAVKNNSVPLGSTTWFQGNAAVFSAQAGAATSYAGANFNNGAAVADISTWLITPTLSFNNGDTLSFFTRTTTASIYPDRLEIRFSNVGGIDVGSTATSLGTFTTLLLSINPTLAAATYPDTWTQYSATITGLSGPTSGSIGFRYFVESGGPLGDNSDYIGLDTVSITAAVPEPTTWALMALGLVAVGLRRRSAGSR